MQMFPPSMMSTNQTIFKPRERSRQASQQKKVMKPQYASYKVAMDHGLAAKAGKVLHKLCCKLVRMVITTMNTKMNPKSSLRKSFTVALLFPARAPQCFRQTQIS